MKVISWATKKICVQSGPWLKKVENPCTTLFEEIYRLQALLLKSLYFRLLTLL